METDKIEAIDKLKEFLLESENYWNKTIDNLSKQLNCELKEVIQLQSEVISIRQILTDQIKNMSYDVYKILNKLRIARRQKFEYYISEYPHKTNSGDKMKLIEWDLANYEHKKDVLDGHIIFLSETLKNIDNLNYSIKNKITLYELTKLD